MYPEHEQTFQVIYHEDEKRGIYYTSNSKSYVFLKNHGTFDDIINTCVHESIHAAIDDIDGQENDEIDEGTLAEKDATWHNDEQEHWAIRNVMWILQDCVSDEFMDQHNIYRNDSLSSNTSLPISIP